MRITNKRLPKLSDLWLFIINNKRFESIKSTIEYNRDYRITVVKNGTYFFTSNSIHELKIWLDLNNLKVTDFGYGDWTQSKDMCFGERGCFLIEK